MDAQNLFGEVISSYSQAQAVLNGELFLLPSKLTREAGITIPVFITEGVKAWLKPTSGAGQSYEGRAWDLLFMGRRAMIAYKGCDRVCFSVLFLKGRRQDLIEVVARVTGDDSGNPCIVLCRPFED